MSSKWKKAACVAGIIGLVVVLGAVHHHIARHHYGHGSAGQASSLADKTGITATGYAEVKLGDTAQSIIQLELSEKASADELQAKVSTFQSKVDNVKAGLAAVGIPADAVRVNSFRISPNYGMPSMKDLMDSDYSYDPFDKAQPTGYRIGATLEITVGSPAQMAQLMKVAADAGATPFDYTYKNGPRNVFFDTATLEPAVKKATEQAKALAAAQAAASGVRLGAIRQITVQQPDYYGGSYDGYRVTVNVTYDIDSAAK